MCLVGAIEINKVNVIAVILLDDITELFPTML